MERGNGKLKEKNEKLLKAFNNTAMNFLIKHISQFLSRRGIQFSASEFKVLSLNKFRIQNVAINRQEHVLSIGAVLIHYSIWQSLFNWKLIGEIKLKGFKLVSNLISEYPFILSKLTVAFTFGSRVKLLLIEPGNNISIFFQLVEEKQSYRIYIESKEVAWNDLIELLNGHLRNEFLRESYSENKTPIYADIIIPKNKAAIPLFQGKIMNETFILYRKNRIDRLYMDEEFLLNIYKLKFGENKVYIPIEDISQDLINAVISTEDSDFWNHHGISPFFVGYALRENLQKGKISRGASTITMQMARNLFLSHDRTIIRKIEECIIALLLENVYYIEKKTILEIYLNLIEFAPNVYGICDASQHYFGKKVPELTLTEILVLTYIIPRPTFFEEALLLQTEQLKNNLYNHIKRHARFLHYREMIEKDSLENIETCIKFKSPYGDLILRDINKIILHCSATKEYQAFTAEDIDKWHKDMGWGGIGYHYVIRLDGTIEAGRPEFEIGAHTIGQNTNSLGVCYIGGLDATGNPKDTRTKEQKNALRIILADLLEKYPDSTVHGHNEYADKACPCFDVEKEFRQ